MPEAAELPNDVEALRRIVLEHSAKLEAAEALLIFQNLELEKLRFEIALPEAHEVRPLLRAARSGALADAALASRISRQASPPSPSRSDPRRRSRPRSQLVGHCLPSFPASRSCTRTPARVRIVEGSCAPLGEDVSEMLEYVPSHFKVIRHVRPKLSCASCQRIVQPLAPSRPIERGIAGPGLLAHVLVVQVLRSPSPVPSEPDLRPRGDRP